MNTNNHNRIRSSLLRIAVLCLCVCLVLGVGVSYARYRTDLMTISYWFKSSFYDTIVMHGAVTEDTDPEAGVWNEIPDTWQTQDWDSAQLDFSISNGDSGSEFAARDQEATIQLIASLSIQNPENLTVTLVTSNEEGEPVNYTGVPEEIRSGSFLQSIYGDGWVYKFADENGEEPAFFLEGGKLSYQNFAVCIEGNVNASLLSIELNGAYVDSK